MILVIVMTNPSLLHLLTWLSPAFPIGGYAWSSGLETACHNESVTNKLELKVWLQTSLAHGTLHSDAILLRAVYEQEIPIEEINALALSLAGSKERFDETTGLGNAFIAASKPWRTSDALVLKSPCAYPVTVGRIAFENNVPLNDTLAAFLHAAISTQIQAALRLMKLGQQAGVELLSELEIDIQTTALNAHNSTLDNLGTSAIRMEISAMNHETLSSRIFRS